MAPTQFRPIYGRIGKLALRWSGSAYGFCNHSSPLRWQSAALYGSARRGTMWLVVMKARRKWPILIAGAVAGIAIASFVQPWVAPPYVASGSVIVSGVADPHAFYRELAPEAKAWADDVIRSHHRAVAEGRGTRRTALGFTHPIGHPEQLEFFLESDDDPDLPLAAVTAVIGNMVATRPALRVLAAPAPDHSPNPSGTVIALGAVLGLLAASWIFDAFRKWNEPEPFENW